MRWEPEDLGRARRCYAWFAILFLVALFTGAVMTTLYVDGPRMEAGRYEREVQTWEAGAAYGRWVQR